MRRLLAIGAAAMALAAATACSTLQTTHGARTLPPGKADFGVAMSVQKGSNPLSYVGIPMPQLEFQGRVGLVKDVDLGFHAWLLGAGFDVRYRIWHRDNLHLAIDPGFGGFYIPTVGGSVEWHAPLIGEAVLSKRFSVSGGPRVVLRDQINPVNLGNGEKGVVSRMDVFAGANTRFEARLGRGVYIGLGGDLFLQPARHALPGYSVGLDFGVRRNP